MGKDWAKGRVANKDAVARVKDLLARGLTRSQIAFQADLTGGAVSGIIRRHCQGAVKHKSVKGPAARAALKAAPKVTPPKPDGPSPFVPRKVDMPEPENLRLDMMGLTADTCRYPHGDGPFVFCGQPAPEEQPYCPYHQELTHQKGSAIAATANLGE